jgi:hypothetical protein
LQIFSPKALEGFASTLNTESVKEKEDSAKIAYHATILYPNNIEKAAEYIHNEWVTRNPKTDSNKKQHAPYNELPDSEKEKNAYISEICKKKSI